MKRPTTPFLRNLSQAFVLGASAAVALTAMPARAICIMDIAGKWQQTHVLIQGNKIPDDTQSWQLKPNGSMQFTKTKPQLNIPGNYRCEGDIIYMSGRMTNQYKIVEHGLDTMTWQSSTGGTVFVNRAGK
jgi:hypothetical protein